MFFAQVPTGLPDPVFGRVQTFQSDPRSHKLNLIIGIYKDRELRNEVMKTVLMAGQKVVQSDRIAEYLPIDGSRELCRGLGALCFGKKNWESEQGRIYSAQTVGGTGALRVGIEFLSHYVGKSVWIPSPTWANHRSVFERAGCAVESIPYYSSQLHGFDRTGYLHKIASLPPKSIVLFHAACHNPTGSDPSIADWEEISLLCKKRSLFPFFDFAYQGFGDGLEEDAAVVRLFLDQGHEMLVAYSASKNFSLYRQRVGALFAVCSSAEESAKAGSQIRRIIRALYSNPPAYGAAVVDAVLSDSHLKQSWISELDECRKRIATMRMQLIAKLNEASKKIDFQFLSRHKGMFSYLDLSEEQVQKLMDEFAVYSLDSGRINIAGLNENNIDYFVESLIEVCGK